LGLIGAIINDLRANGVPIDRVVLIGGGARSEAVRRIAPAVWGLLDVDVSATAEVVADGAARQAAWVLSGTPDPPPRFATDKKAYTAEPTPQVQRAFSVAATAVELTEGDKTG